MFQESSEARQPTGGEVGGKQGQGGTRRGSGSRNTSILGEDRPNRRCPRSAHESKQQATVPRFHFYHAFGPHHYKKRIQENQKQFTVLSLVYYTVCRCTGAVFSYLGAHLRRFLPSPWDSVVMAGFFPYTGSIWVRLCMKKERKGGSVARRSHGCPPPTSPQERGHPAH